MAEGPGATFLYSLTSPYFILGARMLWNPHELKKFSIVF